MRNKANVTRQLEQLDNALTNIASYLNTGMPINQVKDYIYQIKEKLQDIQTLVNTESDSWN